MDPAVRTLVTALVGLSLFVPPSLAGQAELEPTLSRPGGVTLLYRALPGSRVFAARVYLLGGPSVAGATQAGIEPLLLRVAASGSRLYPGRESEARVSRLGAGTFVSAGSDWTVYGVEGLAENFNELWRVFADRMVNPELPEAALDLERERASTLRRASSDDPESQAHALAVTRAFEDHPYRLPPRGWESSLAELTVDDLRAYQERHVVKSRLLVVVVGGVSRDEVIGAVEATLGSLPEGNFEWVPPPAWAADSTTITVEERPLATNYIRGVFGGPLTSAKEYPAFELATIILSNFVERGARSAGISYAAGVVPMDRAASGGYYHVSTRAPGQAIRGLNRIISSLSQVIFNRSDIRQAANNSERVYFELNETPGQQADVIARAYLLRGRLESLDSFLDELHSVDPVDLRRVVRRYFRNFQWAYVGDADLLPAEAMRLYCDECTEPGGDREPVKSGVRRKPEVETPGH
jgi:predicted Zn-dependent peptidase